MSKSLLMAVLLLGLSGTGWSQQDPTRSELSKKTRQNQAGTGDPQQRRAAVRAALEAQREQKSTNAEVAPRGRRQLSPEARQELRQQLRQQRG